MADTIRLLITVKTYPLPSNKYGELVCTGGVKEDGSLIRLYPIDFRHRPYWQWYRKYQWIELEVERHRSDPRPESYRPVLESIRCQAYLSAANNWAERKRFVLARGASSMCALNAMDQKDVSVGIVKPRDRVTCVVEDDDRNWKAEWVRAMQQINLFGPDRQPVEKIPYRFSFQYKCEDTGCKGHKQTIHDWEVGQLYRNMRDKYRDERKACELVKYRCEEFICGPSRDTYFFVGTTLQWGRWIIAGAFYPKKEPSGQK